MLFPHHGLRYHTNHLFGGLAALQPLAEGHTAEHHATCAELVKDSTTYVWEAEKRFKSGCLSLYKAVTAKKVEVARYESDIGGFVAGGPLVPETREVDELVALFTCMAVLNQRDAFYMPGIDLGGNH
jgi:hypothetical protein